MNYGKSYALPELFSFAVEGRASRYECPELPSELAMYAAKHPPAAQDALALGIAIFRSESFKLACLIKIALYLRAQRLKHPRDRHNHRNALAPNSVDYLGWLKSVLKE